MLHISFALPLSQNFVRPPSGSSPSPEWASDPLLFVWLIGAVLIGLLILLLSQRRKRAVDFGRQAILIDGSNVMHWRDNTPSLEPLQQVVSELSLLGLKPGVVFDANVGYKLEGRYLGEAELSRRLFIPAEQIFVVPKGTQADPYLLETARGLKARIVTNDLYRDWATDFPEVEEPGLLVSGGMKAGRVWLDGLQADENA